QLLTRHVYRTTGSDLTAKADPTNRSRLNTGPKRYAAEFKRDAVALALSSEETVTEVARDLGVSPEGLRGWVKQAKIDSGEGPAGALTTAEREELVRLRRKVREQEATIEVLGKATAFFAQDRMR
ncbi:transposase, partial [Streptomyces sp. NPDC058622]|uniref:transposase n=1 Tax=Streptomyces sp. NPDC058622 TaxID=3346562 RepID=UPI00365160E9